MIRHWLRDRAARRHVMGFMLLLAMFCASAAAQGQSGTAAGAVLERPSLLDRWLAPDVVIGAALFILYAGELRGDMKRLKAQQAAFQVFKDSLHDELDRKFMSRETVEARLRALERRRTD